VVLSKHFASVTVAHVPTLIRTGYLLIKASSFTSWVNLFRGIMYWKANNCLSTTVCLYSCSTEAIAGELETSHVRLLSCFFQCPLYCHVFGVAWLIIMGSGFDDWIYWHFFTITINYYSSYSILTAEASLQSASRSTTLNWTLTYTGNLLVCRCIPILLMLLNSQFQFSNSTAHSSRYIAAARTTQKTHIIVETCYHAIA
jgi:hypothetical protein